MHAQKLITAMFAKHNTQVRPFSPPFKRFQTPFARSTSTEDVITTHSASSPKHLNNLQVGLLRRSHSRIS